MAEFTTAAAHAAALLKRHKEVKKGRPLQIAATASHSQKVKRIFVLGLMPVGRKIGKYNTRTPLYVAPKRLPIKVAPRGKTGKTTFESGKKHKTAWFPSYSALRRQQGRQHVFIHMVLSGNLQSDFRKPVKRQNPTTFIEFVSRDENGKKIRGLERRFGKIWSGNSKGEIATFRKVYAFEVAKIMQG